MLHFDIVKLESESCNKPELMLSMLFYHWQRGTPVLPSNKRFRSKVPLDGHSYMLNPEAFFRDKSTDILYKIQYLKLLAKRDYLLYKAYKYSALQLSYFPDINLKAIKHNPLLIITDKEIKFKYEELKNGTSIRQH